MALLPFPSQNNGTSSQRKADSRIHSLQERSTLLHFAAAYNQIEIMHHLIERRADVCLQDNVSAPRVMGGGCLPFCWKSGTLLLSNEKQTRDLES